jgi:hypothetical protein
MPSLLDIAKPADNHPASKQEFRAAFGTIKAELEHGGFYVSNAPGARERTTHEKLAERVSVKDFGAEKGARGDGQSHSLSTQTIAARRELGFSGINRFDDLDAEDTEDFFSFAMALKYLERQGGGTLFVPRGHYVIRRPLWLPSNVSIEGESKHTTTIENSLSSDTNEWTRLHRISVFFAGLHHPISFTLDSDKALAHYEVADVLLSEGQRHVALRNYTDITNLRVGDFIFIRTASSYLSNIPQIPSHAFPNRIVDIDLATNEILLEYPIKSDLTSGNALIAHLGTNNTGGTYADPGGWIPHQFSCDSSISNLTLIGRKITGENGWYRGSFKHCKLIANDRGIIHNCMFRCDVEDIDITTTGGRAIESKGCSHDTSFRRINIFQSAKAPVSEPILSVGESSEDMIYEDITIRESPYAHVSKIYISTATNITLRRVRLESSSGNGTMLQLNGHPALGRPPLYRLEDIDLIAKGSGVVRWVRIRGGSFVEAKRVKVTGPASAAPQQQFWLEDMAGGFFADVKLPPEVQISGSEGSWSSIDGVYGADHDALVDSNDPINQVYRKRGLPVFDTTNSRLLWPLGLAANAPWITGDGAISVSAAELRDSGAAINGSRKQARTVAEAADSRHRVIALGDGAFDPWESTPGHIIYRPGRPVGTSEYRWTPVGSTDQYYLELRSGGNPGLALPSFVVISDATLLFHRADYSATLSFGEWSFAVPQDADFTTVLVRLPNEYAERDPNLYPADFIRFGPSS